MAKAKAEEKVKIYNKGRRAWPLEWKEDEDLKKCVCNPNRSVEVPKSVADRMMKNYPNDFLEGEALASTSSSDVKKLKSENSKLKKQLEAKDGEIEELKKQLEELTAPNAKAAEGSENKNAGGE